ncbi:Hypothetical predicted protein [Podarcis lilfordi]|uniref:Uncharacterized protein n=1 Tax=Podarcis lilfordi TaxID=74358 RepID=A0AA35PSF6_9SAUR|nr:Hypothetical predicted protein [Podarcis lilfordi]
MSSCWRAADAAQQPTFRFPGSDKNPKGDAEGSPSRLDCNVKKSFPVLCGGIKMERTNPNMLKAVTLGQILGHLSAERAEGPLVSKSNIFYSSPLYLMTIE